MPDITLPPEMLPTVRTGDAEVVVCRGAPKCEGQAIQPCPFCVRVDPDNSSVEDVLRLINLVH
jgi:hypothetical protein